MSISDDGIQFETDPRFPSGKWVGFFIQKNPPLGKQWMELDMHFVNGSLHASGRDLVGAFFFKGKYDLASGKCHWTKTYPGKHEVLYQGYQEGKSIWGAWEIAESFFGIALKGGFKIWPGETGAREGEELHEEVEVEIELVVPAMAPRLAR